MRRAREKSFRLCGELIHPGDCVLVLRDGYCGRHGVFRGIFSDGRLAVNVSLGSCRSSQLHLLPREVKRLEGVRSIGRTKPVAR